MHIMETWYGFFFALIRFFALFASFAVNNPV